jgi:hypothetical protein
MPNGAKVYKGKIYGFSAEGFHTKSHHQGRQDVETQNANGWCSDTTIQNAGSDSSPLISDCTVAMNAVYSMAGTNNSFFGRSECGASAAKNTCYYPVVQYESCLFGASPISTGSTSVRIGWNDVGDLIKNSIAQFGNNPSNGKVGTLGQMNCPEEVTAGASYATSWGLYHS